MIKLNWLSYASDLTCQPLRHIECDSVSMLARTSRRGKVLIFKAKAPSFHTTKCSDINYFPYKINQILGFWAGQGIKLRRNTYFRRFKSSFAVNYHVPKRERLVLSKMWISIFSLSKGAQMITTSGQLACGIWIKI